MGHFQGQVNSIGPGTTNMPLGVNTNVAANGVLSSLSNSQSVFNTEVKRLSSGLRINSAADDPTGLVFSQKYAAQTQGLGQAINNAREAINLVQTAEGALDEISTALRSIRTLAVHRDNTGVNGSDTTDDGQITKLLSEIDHIVDRTYYGSASNQLLNGTTVNRTFQVGAFQGDTESVQIPEMHSFAALLNLASTPISISAADAAISAVATERATLGSFQKDVLESAVRNLSTSQENLTASRSTITDTNMAQESLAFSKSQILQQTGLAMLAQANQAPQQLLSLFR